MIQSSAPARIDFAGGTLDIWPLYLFYDNPPTLNAAIDCYATVTLAPRKGKAIIVESVDLDRRESFASLDALPTGAHPLTLILKTLAFYRPRGGMTITTHCQAPAGSGIGGSSALNIALHGALNAWTERKLSKEQMLRIAKSIETQVIGVPTGWQDYFPALYGGDLSVRPDFEGVGRERIPIDLQELSRRFILCYSGEPRKSAINNWEVMKQAVDKKSSMLKRLDRLQNISRNMEPLLAKGQWKKLARALTEEGAARKALAPNIATPEMNRLIAQAKRAGAKAAKVCGAGGGGCIAFMIDPESRTAVETALQKAGGRLLPFRFVRRGLQVRRS